MYKKRAKFTQGVRIGTYTESIYADHPLIGNRSYRNKRTKKIPFWRLPLVELREYGSSLSLSCRTCENSSMVDLDVLIETYGNTMALADIRAKIYCNVCKSKEFDWKVLS